MRTCERCGGRMRPFVARKTVGGKRVCEGCAGAPMTGRAQHSAGLKNLAALENPIADRTKKHPEEWYHGSPHDFEHLGDPADHQDPEMEEYTDRYKHWNTLVGNHFTSDHRVAQDFSGGEHSHSEDMPADYEGPMGHVIHAKLHLKNPKVYASEHDMDQEVYEHEWEAGNHHDKHMPPPPEDDDEYEEWAEEQGHRRHYAGDSQHKYSKDESDPNYAYGFHPKATGWLNTHPDKEGIVRRYKDRMKRAGYDGVVYGNEYEDSEHAKSAKSAIAFEPHQIEITQHHYGAQGCLSEQEAKRRMVHPDQQTIPGLPDFKRKLPQERRPDTSKPWPKTFTPSYFESGRAHRPSWGDLDFDPNATRQTIAGRRRGYDTGRLWAPLPQECWDRYYGRQGGSQGRTAKSWTMKYLTYNPEGGYLDKETEVEGPFYHGSRSKRLTGGDRVTPGRKTNPWGDEGSKSQHVFFTTELRTASDYAQQAGGHVYEVEPTGDFSTDYGSGDYKTKHPLKVVRRLDHEEWSPTHKEAKLDHSGKTFWHGSATGDLRGGTYGLHVGSREAARQALTAAIGHPVDGEWDGTREYGKTLLAGKHTLNERGITPTGYNYLHAPDHDHYPTGGAGFQATDTKIPMDAKPDIFPVRITGEMSNDMLSPHEDFKANGYMKAQLKRGRAKRGYFYTNQGEDYGSISAVVPNGDHLERLPRSKTAIGEESARQHAGQQDVFAVRSGNGMTNMCRYHAETHVNNRQAADDLGEQLGLSPRERSAEMLGEPRKGRCSACEKGTADLLKMMSPLWVRNADATTAQGDRPRPARRKDKPLRTKPLPSLRQSENIRRASRGDVFHADSGFNRTTGGVRFHPDGTPQNLGDHTIPAGSEVHTDETEAWNKAIEHWKNGRTDFPRVYVAHDPKVQDGKLTHEAEASELDYDHERHPAIRSDDEEPHEPIMYHGTTKHEDAEDPEEITPSGGSQSFGPGVADPSYAYATPSLNDAWTYAHKRSENGMGGKPTVYRVTPHKPEDVEEDPKYAGDYSRGNYEHDKRSKSGFEVLDEVPMSQRQEHEWQHSPFNDEAEDEDYGDEEDDHHYASLKTLADWDDEDEDYEPDECEHCGEDKNSEDHAEVHHDWIRDQKWHTDWDGDRQVGAHNNNEIQRGMAISLPKDVHRIVHDEDRPLEERGRALAEHVIKSANDQGHIGRFWTDEDSVAQSYATGSRVRAGSKDDNGTPATPVTLHVKFPGYHHIETDPDELEHHGVYSYHIEDNREVPLQHGTPLEAVGVSWAHHKYGDDGTRHWDRDNADWQRHTFKEPIKAMSSKKPLPTLQMLAHDATENEALRHCPFCGAGKIIGRADGSVECEFCHHYFTVQVQPQYPNFPQTINGMPQQIPGMPGQVEQPAGAPGMDGGGFPPGDEGQDAGGGPPWAQDGAQSFPDDAAEDKQAGDDEDEEEPPPFAKQSSLPLFRTTAGARLNEDDYVRHLAIRFAPDRDAMISRIREERGAR